MKILISKAVLGDVLRWTQRGLFGVGLLLLGYCVFVLADSWTFQTRHGRNLDLQSRQAEPKRDILQPQKDSPAAPVDPPPSAMAEGLVGRLEIARLGLSVIVAEGIDKLTLRRAVGHIPGTALPGGPGNIGLAGHRDTFFRPLEGVEVDDIITLTTPAPGSHLSYRVISLRVVSPDDVSVLNPTSNEVLTLVTCHPFSFVGPAPNRFIVRAERFVP